MLTPTVTGHEWSVLSIEYYKNGRRMGDGDTLRLHRTTIQLLGDKPYRLTDHDPLFLPCRLAWVDTPEPKDPVGYAKAAADLTRWIDRHAFHDLTASLTAVCFGRAGWDRELIDLRCALDGESASQWLMAEGNDGQGWPAYDKNS